MSRILTIGEYSGNPFLVSSNKTGSTLTSGTSHVYLRQSEEDEDCYTFRFDDRGNAEFKVRIGMNAADDDALQALINLVHAQLLAVRSGEVKFEYASAKKRWELPIDWQASFTMEAELMADDEGAYFEVAFRSGPDSGNTSGTPIGTPTWRIAISAGGYMHVIGECTFGNRTDANAWVDGLDDKSLFPAWMPAADFKFFDHAIVVDGQSVSLPTTPDTSADNLHFVTVDIRQTPELLGGAAFNQLRDFSYSWDESDMPPNVGRGPLPGKAIMVHGTLWFKTGSNTSWNSSDATKSDFDNVYSEASTAIDIIVQTCEDSFPFRLRHIQRKGRLNRRTGEYTFEVMLVMPDQNHKDITVEEHVELHFDPEFEFLTRADGIKNAFADPGGMSVTLTHRYRVTSFRRPTYRPPVTVGGTWVCAPGSIPDPQPENYGNGETQWTLDATVTWHRLSTSSGDVVKPLQIGSGRVDPRFLMRGK